MNPFGMPLEKNKKIAIICPHPLGVAPGQRLKYEQYFDHWRMHGYDVEIFPFQSMRFWNINPKNGFILEKIFWTIIGYFQRFLLLFKLWKYDVVYVFLWVTPFGPPIFEWLVCKISKKIIFDIDDLVFMGNASAANSWVSRLKGRQKPIYLMKHADHVITCTPFLDTFVRQYNSHTTDISSTICTQSYQVANTYQNDHKIVLGWSGSHSTSKYLLLLYPMLLALRQKYEFKLIAMGVPADFKMEGLDLEIIPWSEENEIPTLQRFDIGLYPLPNEQWVHGKSGLKAIQYMGVGIPTVAQNIGEAIQRVVLHQKNGFLVNGYMEEWLDALSNLIENPSLRKEIGTIARAHIVSHFSIEANAPLYLKVIGG
jgi:glycosyltransferase involved in cell wall biosynthesis